MIMVRIVTAVLLLALSAFEPALAAEFCDGYQRGYVMALRRAFQSNANFAMPACIAMPARMISDPPTDFERRYLRGIEDGFLNGGWVIGPRGTGCKAP